MVSRRAAQRGVSYIALLLAVAITSGALAASATVWSQWQRRERETQLLWAGDQIRRAILAYAQAGAESGAGFPRSLEELLLDPRSPAPRRFLRQIYEDPMTRSTEWGLIRNLQGQLVGVYSRATGVPVKKARFATAYASFEGATRYADWRFSAVETPALSPRPPARPAPRPASAAAGPPPAVGLPGAGAASAGAATLPPPDEQPADDPPPPPAEPAGEQTPAPPDPEPEADAGEDRP